jgi:hypothetical protein
MSNEYGSEWLRRNAQPVDFEAAQGASSTSWKRALNDGPDAGIVQRDDELGRYRVTMPGRDGHEVLYIESEGKRGAGACDCEAYRMHDLAGNVCAHLATLRQSAALSDRIEIHTNREYVERLVGQQGTTANAGDEPATGEVVDEMDGPDTAGETQAGPEAINSDPQGAEVVDVQDTSDVPAEPEQTFAGPLSDEVDDQYVMEMGGETYIRRAGYAVLAKRQGFHVRTQILEEPPHGTPEGQVVAIGKVVNGDGDLVAQDYGTAGPPDKEDMDGASHNLLELAATRAATRATAWATGEGLTAVAEVEPGEEVHQP